MTPQLLLVILVAVGLVVFVVAVTLAAGRQAQRRAVQVRALAERIGARVDRVSPAVLRGTLAGRPYVLSGRRSGPKTGAVASTHIEVPLARPLRLQIEPQRSDLGARIAGDQALGDEAFDSACFLRVSDLDALRHALDAEMRRTLGDASRSDVLYYVASADGPLRMHVRGAPDDPRHEERVTGFLTLAVTLASRLDGDAAAAPRGE